MKYEQTLRYIVENLVDNPDAVKITSEKEENQTVYHVETAPEEAGKVIGRQGAVVSAIRNVLSSIASKNRERVYVKVLSENN